AASVQRLPQAAFGAAAMPKRASARVVVDTLGFAMRAAVLCTRRVSTDTAHPGVRWADDVVVGRARHAALAAHLSGAVRWRTRGAPPGHIVEAVYPRAAEG